MIAYIKSTVFFIEKNQLIQLKMINNLIHR